MSATSSTPPAPGSVPIAGRPRVAYVIQAEDFSGAEILHAPLLQADPDALVICPPDSRVEEFVRGLGATTAPLPFRPLRVSAGRVEILRSLGRAVATARDLRRLLGAHPNRDLIYCISIRPGLVAALATLGRRRPMIWYLTDFLRPPPVRRLTHLLAHLSRARGVAISRCVSEEFTGRSLSLARRTTVVYPGIDPSRFIPTATPGVPRAAVLGQVSPTKRTDLAVEVAARVVRQVPEFKLEILGRAQFRNEDFALERSLRKRVASDPELSGAVAFPGYTSDVARELRGFGLLLHCRPDEPFGMALIEAMATGLPVVAPDSDGPAEIVDDGVTGLLYPPGDADAAARCVTALLTDAQLAAQIGAGARKAVERRFTADRQLAELEEVLATAADLTLTSSSP